MVTIAPSIASRSSNFGIATISLDFSADFHLPEHKTLTGGEGRYHMDGAFTGLATRAAHGLPIDRDHALRHAGQRRDPGDETALELLRVEGGEDVAEMIMRRACRRGTAGSGGEDRASSRQSGRFRRRIWLRPAPRAAPEEDLIKRIRDLAALAWVRQIVEMIEKYNCLEESLVVVPPRRP